MAVSSPAWDAAQFEGLYRCVHCGLCLGACPTYRELGLETDSPRGRLYLMRAMVEGQLELTEGVAEHMNRCLVCRACETACPSGVPFGHLMELTRDEMRRRRPESPNSGPSIPTPLGRIPRLTVPAVADLFRRLMLRQVVPSRTRMRLLATGTKLYRRSGLQRLVRTSRLLPKRLAQAEELMPAVSDEPFAPPAGEWFRAAGQVRYRVGLLAGCVMSVAFAGVDRATVRVLNHNGCDAFVPAAQTCCGALHAHDGDRETARELARRNIEAFAAEELDAVIMNAAGCGAMMKAYGELLEGDPRAAAFAAKVKDVTEFLAGIDFNRNFGPIDRTVVFQDPCHLAHGQGIREQPRELLRAIPGLRLVEMKNADQCCGSAGIYNLTQPDLSLAFMRQKSENIAATGAETVVSANPGCMIQLEAGLRQRAYKADVKHIVEILDEAYNVGEELHADELDAGIGRR